MSSGEIDKSDLIERLLKSRLDESSQAQPDLNDPSLTNFTPEEMELLKNVTRSLRTWTFNDELTYSWVFITQIYMSNQNMAKGESNKNYKAFMPEPGWSHESKANVV